MCGRYQFTAEQSVEILQIIQEVEKKYGEKAARTVRQGEISPLCKMPVLVASDEGPAPELYTWGFRTGSKPVINARAETAAEKPMFRDCVVSRRCVVPSTGFYEWDGDRRKFHFSMPNSAVLYMAGLYDIRGGIPCFCILTTEANESMRNVHHRMPLVLKREQIMPWLAQPERSAEFLRMTPPQLDKFTTEAQIGLW
ncbi:MAG: SOS response-associated peptidase [Schwartzia sp.]|nr:SOS response-associated peptidase [Schwartzia sp. (in: firmicutes)]MBQ9721753.1 SOS response-associated peptidase [Oscillospiraceae bacterium]